MNTQARKSPPNQHPPEKTNNTDNFDFDLWAKEVKRQMIAALSKNSSL